MNTIIKNVPYLDPRLVGVSYYTLTDDKINELLTDEERKETFTRESKNDTIEFFEHTNDNYDETIANVRRLLDTMEELGPENFKRLVIDSDGDWVELFCNRTIEEDAVKHYGRVWRTQINTMIKHERDVERFFTDANKFGVELHETT